METSPQIDPRERDAALILALRSGDESAAQTLFEIYQPRCVFFLGLWSGDEELARELAAEAMSRLLVKAATGGVREPRGFAEFAYGLTHNIWRQFAARKSRERRRVVVVDPENLEHHADSTDTDRAFTAAAAVDRKRHLEEALASLPDHYRRILELRFGDGLAHNEIAAKLGLDPANTRQRLRRARQQFRIEFERIGGT